MKIDLTEAEAMVLSDWLHRNSKKDLFYDDQAEQYVLWSIEAQLEKHLDDIFSNDYTERLARAREDVRKNY